MKAIRLLALMMTLFGGIAIAVSQETVTITVGEWPPYVSTDLPGYGIAPRIVTAAFNEEKVKVQYVFFPWARALDAAKNGDYDATLLWVRTSERERNFLFSDVVIVGKAVFYHLKAKQFSWRTVDDLKGLNIGGLNSGSYPWFESALKAGVQLKMDMVNDEPANFRKLLAGNIDIFSLDQLTGAAILKKSFTPEEIDRITFDSKPIESWDYCLMFSKKSAKAKQFIMLFNKGLQELKRSGRYKQLTE